MHPLRLFSTYLLPFLMVLSPAAPAALAIETVQLLGGMSLTTSPSTSPSKVFQNFRFLLCIRHTFPSPRTPTTPLLLQPNPAPLRRQTEHQKLLLLFPLPLNLPLLLPTWTLIPHPFVPLFASLPLPPSTSSCCLCWTSFSELSVIPSPIGQILSTSWMKVIGISPLTLSWNLATTLSLLSAAHTPTSFRHSNPTPRLSPYKTFSSMAFLPISPFLTTLVFAPSASQMFSPPHSTALLSFPTPSSPWSVLLLSKRLLWTSISQALPTSLSLRLLSPPPPSLLFSLTSIRPFESYSCTSPPLPSSVPLLLLYLLPRPLSS